MERPRLPYSSFINGVEGHHELSPDEGVSVRAVDLMLDALREDPVFEQTFMNVHGLTLGDKQRLTDQEDLAYGKDVLWGVHSPGDLFAAVLINSTEVLDQNRHLQDWGRRMLKHVGNMNGDDLDNSAKTMIIHLVSQEKRHFGLEPVDGLEPATVSTGY